MLLLEGDDEEVTEEEGLKKQSINQNPSIISSNKSWKQFMWCVSARHVSQMKYHKISNLLNDSTVSVFVTIK